MHKQAVIFDMDGVISDTQKFHALSENQLLKQYGIDLSPDKITKKYAGVPDIDMFTELFQLHGIKVDLIDKVILKKWEIMGQMAAGNITAIPDAVALIQTFKKAGLKLAVASASTLAFIKEVMAELNIGQYFDALVSTEEVKHGKPSPEIFLLAAKKLSVIPEACVVIEDGRNGLIATSAANMKSTGLVSDLDSDYPATKLVTALAEVTTELIDRL